jgi:signal transduction histidine kinase
MQTLPRRRPLLIYGAVVALLAIGVFFIPGIGPSLFQTNGFAPHGVCILWQPNLLWFHVINDVLIGASYVAIAGSLAYLVYRGRRDLPFHWILLAFGLFIVSCGSTHFMEAWTFWTPLYWLSGYTKLITAIASVTTAIALPPIVPRVLRLVDDARVSNERKLQLEVANIELAQLNVRLAQLGNLKSQLFANVSHELRTPLTLILGPVERLLATAPAEQQRELLTIQSNAQLLQRHVDDLLDVARLEAGRLELQQTRVDLTRLVYLTTDYFSTAAEAGQLTLQVDAPAELAIAADAHQIQRVLVNLLSNALKFTPVGGTIRFGLQAAEQTAILTVEDSGPGIPATQRETIFERFHQGDGGATRRYGGTGLGLAIARELITLHGGTVTVDTSVLGGARFTITLPIGDLTRYASDTDRLARRPPLDATLIAVQPEIEPTPVDIDAAMESQAHILVVEDNPDVRRFLVETLNGRYRVTTASNGAAGVEQALKQPPDLIVSDVMMPGLSGNELVAALRSHAELDQTPIVMLTARADADLRLQLLQGGAQDYLLKPFSATELLARLNNLLVVHQARRTLQQLVHTQASSLAELSHEVVRLYSETQAALRLRDEFIAVAAHELRTPVTALMANTHLLLRRSTESGRFAERDLRALRAVGAMSERLAAMIERLLDLARIERDQFLIVQEPLDLGDLLERVSESLSPTLDQHRLVLQRAPMPLPISGDAALLTQVISNLLTNAAKYSAPGSTITLTAQRAASYAEVAVRDEGIGIPTESLPHLFERFYRAPNTNATYTGGLGLGLYLAREIVTRHGGGIGVESAEGQGSVFTLRLPIAS